jgi:hypothetical protein
MYDAATDPMARALAIFARNHCVVPEPMVPPPQRGNTPTFPVRRAVSMGRRNIYSKPTRRAFSN